MKSRFSLTAKAEQRLTSLLDRLAALWPQRTPSAAQFANCHIISHRGERDDVEILENSFAAFDPLIATGVWGIEFDVRWTSDLQPVVYHDPDLRRLHRSPLEVASLSLPELQQHYPGIPSLRALVQRYYQHFHLCIELKTVQWQNQELQERRLQEALAPLKPGHDYHLMSFDRKLLDSLKSFPAQCKFAIVRTDRRAASDHAFKENWAGIGAHFALLNPATIDCHLQAGQLVGVGFPRSRNSLYREIGRNIPWIFTNHALKLIKYVPVSG